MDTLLEAADQHFFTPFVYPEEWDEGYAVRQFISLLLLMIFGGYALYFLAAGLSYIFVFDKRLLKHPLILEVSFI